MKQATNKGYTLIELLLVIGIFAIMITFATPVTLDFFTRNEVINTQQQTKHFLFRAQTLARAGAGDSQWGVRILSGNLTLFRGSSYASRNAQYDEITTFATSITATGSSEIVFARFSGVPASASAIFLSNKNANRTISVNTEGRIDE